MMNTISLHQKQDQVSMSYGFITRAIIDRGYPKEEERCVNYLYYSFSQSYFLRVAVNQMMSLSRLKKS